MYQKQKMPPSDPGTGLFWVHGHYLIKYRKLKATYQILRLNSNNSKCCNEVHVDLFHSHSPIGKDQHMPSILSSLSPWTRLVEHFEPLGQLLV